jgi:hypothetical protein
MSYVTKFKLYDKHHNNNNLIDIQEYYQSNLKLHSIELGFFNTKRGHQE